jgi:hypothetical protein
VKAGDLVRYTSSGNPLGAGIVLKVKLFQGAHVQNTLAKVMLSGGVRFRPIRWISLEYLEVIDESR